MSKYRLVGALVIFSLVLFGQPAGRLAAQPRGDAGPGMGPGMMGPGMMGPGMMGPGMMGPGMMGPGMMQGPGVRSTGGSATGAAVFRDQCAACHTLGAGGASAIGPNLHGLFGRPAGRVAGYGYSAAMRRSGVVWNTMTLDAFLADPHSFIPGNKMPFPGIPERKQRQALIDYLRSATR